MPWSPAGRTQQTLARPAVVRGIGFVSEADVTLRFLPAEPDAGIRFRRVDLPGRPELPAHVRHVAPRRRRTALEHAGATVEMVEHVLAALAGLRVDNCVVELDAPETPGCDGSSLAFVEALVAAGIVAQDRPRPTLVVDRPITVGGDGASLTAYPAAAGGCLLAYHLEYVAPIGRQSQCVPLDPASFRDQLAPCRTFLLAAEAEAMRAAGLGRRLGPSDLLVFGPDGPIDNALRYPDECVRHKILDLVGDLALAGCDLVGHVVAHRSGHQLNAALVRALLAAAEAEPPAADAAEPPPPPAQIDINEILGLLPHRYPLLLIDRVIGLEPGRRIRALKNVTVNEPFFQGHWPARPIMPGVLILEALAQAAGVLIARTIDCTNAFALFASIDGVKMRRPVVPGDQLVLDVTARRIGSRMAEVAGAARVDGQLAAEAKFRFVFVAKERAA